MTRPFRWAVVEALRDEIDGIDQTGKLIGEAGHDATSMFETIKFCEFAIDQPFRIQRSDGTGHVYHGDQHPACLINDDIGASPIIGAQTLARNVSENPASRYIDGADLGPFDNNSGHVEWPMVFQLTPPITSSDAATCEALFLELTGIQRMLSKVRRDTDNILGLGNRYPCVMNVEWGRGYVRRDERTNQAFALLRVTLTVMENYENPYVD